MSITTLQNFYKETIKRRVTVVTAVNIYVTVKPTATSGWLVISPSSTTLREIIKYTSTGTDGNGDYVVCSERGVGGTTAQTHEIGEAVRMNYTAEHQAEIDTMKSTVSSGAGVPASTPTKIGDIYVDTTNSKVYISKGISSNADWLILN